MTNDVIYTPVLKWKRAEQKALKNFPIEDRNRVMPLIEVVLPTVQRLKDKIRKVKKTDDEMLSEMVQKYKEERIPKIPQEIKSFWGAHPIYIDFSLVHNGVETTKLKVESIKTIIPAAMRSELRVITVVNLNDASEIKAAVRAVNDQYRQGVCVRVSASDLIDTGRLNEKLHAFLSEMGLDHKDTDLLIDLKGEQGGSTYAKLFSLAQQIEDIVKWRSFVFASGAFPTDLMQCKRDEPTTLTRHDWLNWVKQTSGEMNRKPRFADYAIRTPLFDESLQYRSATKSIKYTIGEGWYVLKGTIEGFEDFLGNAKLLVESSGHFYGEDFSTGDKYIAEKAKHFDLFIIDPSIKGTGTNESWIGAGINHHLALVVHQVSSLEKKLSPVPSRQVILDPK